MLFNVVQNNREYSTCIKILLYNCNPVQFLLKFSVLLFAPFFLNKFLKGSRKNAKFFKASPAVTGNNKRMTLVWFQNLKSKTYERNQFWVDHLKN